jgi:hypothetical protein
MCGVHAFGHLALSYLVSGYSRTNVNTRSGGQEARRPRGFRSLKIRTTPDLLIFCEIAADLAAGLNRKP